MRNELKENYQGLGNNRAAVQPPSAEMAELRLSSALLRFPTAKRTVSFPKGYNRMGRQLVLLVKHEQAAL